MKTFIKKFSIENLANMVHSIHRRIMENTLIIKPLLKLSPIHSTYKTSIRKK
jgi:hypothetical protein